MNITLKTILAATLFVALPAVAQAQYYPVPPPPMVYDPPLGYGYPPPPPIGYYPQPDPGLAVVGAILAITPLIVAPRHYGFGPRHYGYDYGGLQPQEMVR
jgi:hypothetical protein